MIGKGPLVLWDCMILLELDPESCVKSEVVDIEVEEVMGIKEEENPVLMTFPQIKTEHEISCMSVCPQ
jgi:hypothetical protein